MTGRAGRRVPLFLHAYLLFIVYFYYICGRNNLYMSRFVIYIPLPLYLSEWAVSRLGSPVTFPPSSPQNAVIRTYLCRRPADAAPDLGGEGLTAVAIPDSVAKPADQFNYMGERGKAAVAETIKDLFLRALWSDISPLNSSPVGLNKLIAAWCEMNGIGLDRVETVRQCYYRLRRDFGKKGVNIKKGSQKI